MHIPYAEEYQNNSFPDSWKNFVHAQAAETRRSFCLSVNARYEAKSVVSLELLLVERVLCCRPSPICCSEKTIGPVGCLMATVGFWLRTATGSGSCLVEASTDEVWLAAIATVGAQIFVSTIFRGLNFRRNKFLWVVVAHENLTLTKNYLL